ncbi:MAG: CRTAC1 family protein, partial [Gemmatimonadota bacterium]
DFTRVRGVPSAADRASTGGVSWVDYDGDGDEDLYVTNGYTVTEEPTPEPNRLYRNDGGQLVPVETTPLTADSAFSSGSTWGDYDNDGDLDVFVSNQRGQDNLLFRNEGDGRFTRIEGIAPVEDGGASYASTWVDVDGDGHLDLHVSNGGLSGVERDFLYRNRGDGTFERITAGPIVEDSTASTSALWADYDDDGDPDLFVADRWALPHLTNRLYRNEGGWRFTRVATGPVVTDTMRAHSAAWGDCDNDGAMDLYVGADAEANRLYVNDGRGGFEPGPSGPHVLDGGATNAVGWADIDNDGDLDLVVHNWGAAPAVYENVGGCTFRRIMAGDLGREIGYASSLAWADFDDDGDLDLYLGNWPNWEGGGEENMFYRNDGANGHWLKVRLVGTRSNRAGLGARVTAHATIRGESVIQTRERTGASTFRSQDASVLHFGMGDADAVDRLVIRWPSGAIDELVDVPLDRTITITEGGEWTVAATGDP